MSWSRNRVRILSLILAVVAAPLAAAAAAQPRPAAITKVLIRSAGGEGSITIEADGLLPPPTAGTLDSPPRIFFDFVGVVTRVPLRTPSSDPRILRVRVALHRASPPTTRVVIDLAEPLPHHVELLPQQLVMRFGLPPAADAGAAAAVPAALPAPPAAAPRASAATNPPPTPSRPSPSPSPSPSPRNFVRRPVSSISFFTTKAPPPAISSAASRAFP